MGSRGGKRSRGRGIQGGEGDIEGGRYAESAKCGGIQSQVAATVAGQWQYPSSRASPRRLPRLVLPSLLFCVKIKKEKKY